MTSILISGASIAGPTLAYWLRKAGFAPTLIERGPAMRPGGQAIDIRGVALAVIDGMELLATAREKRTQMRGVSMIDETGKEIWRSEERTLSGGRFDNDDVEILKDDLSTLLYDATKNDCEYLFRTTIASLSRASDMSGLGSAWFVRFLNRRSHVAGGSDGACFGCDRLASCGTTELRGGWGATGIERASFSSVAGRVRGSWRGRAGRPARTGEFVSRSRGRSGVVGGDVSDAVF